MSLTILSKLKKLRQSERYFEKHYKRENLKCLKHWDLTGFHPRFLKITSGVQFRNEPFFVKQDHTRIYGETYLTYIAAGNSQITPLGGKRAIYEWRLTNGLLQGLPKLVRYVFHRIKIDNFLEGWYAGKLGNLKNKIIRGEKTLNGCF